MWWNVRWIGVAFSGVTPLQAFSSSSPCADLDDPLADLLDELDLEETKSEPKKGPSKKAVPSPTGTPVLKTKEPGLYETLMVYLELL